MDDNFNSLPLKDKAANIWYYYKYPIIIGAILLVLIAICVRQCAQKIDPDLTVVVASNKTLLTENDQMELQSYFSGLTADVNGDGRSSADIDVLSFDNVNTGTAMQSKLILDFQTGDAIIFITDDATYQKLKSQNAVGNLQEILPDCKKITDDRLAIGDTAMASQSFAKHMGSLKIMVRPTKGTSIDTKANAANIRNAEKVLRKLASG